MCLMFVGWEGVGLCSYLLIGFYFHRKSASNAANKAFIVNRIGDAGFLLGMFTIAWYFGSLRFTEITAMARSGHFAIGDPIITAATLLLFVGACGKSAQIPLYVWLPDAMEGPTPVSALIHAATMVTAGVYMVARSNALFVLAPGSMKTVAIIGAFTALFAATDRPGAERHQARAGLLHRVASWDTCSWPWASAHSRRAYSTSSPTPSSRPVVPRRRIGHPRHERRAGHAQHGRPAPQHPDHSLDHVYRNLRHCRHSPVRRIFLEGRNPVASLDLRRRGLPLAVAGGLRDCADDRVLHVPPDVPHFPRPAAHEPRGGTSHPRIAEVDDGAADRPGHLRRRAGWLGWPHSLGGSNRFEKFLEPVFAGSQSFRRRRSRPAGCRTKEEEHSSRGRIFPDGFSIAAAAGGFGMAWKPIAMPARVTPSRSPSVASSLHRLLQQVVRR